jgi:hypothetical protein
MDFRLRGSMRAIDHGVLAGAGKTYQREVANA